MKLLTTLPLLALVATLACSSGAAQQHPVEAVPDTTVHVGAERTSLYLPQLRGKRVALLSNHTGILPDGRHTVDMLVDSGINVTRLFSPEHGFRGTADAGAHVASGRDSLTGLPVTSLYGGGEKTLPDDYDVLLVDLQDVGARFYTYHITMAKMLEEAARRGKPVIVLDRPNPLIEVMDGPGLDDKYKSGVGQFPIPLIHGMTMGELARMMVGEGWLKQSPTLEVIPVEHYTRHTRYDLPVPPSPNLRTMQAIYLYPSLCLFEGTPLSVGRGTDRPFTLYGHPALRSSLTDTVTFTPRDTPGAHNPPLEGELCYGVDLANIPVDSIIARGLDLTYVIDAYRNTRVPGRFFKQMFDLLSGSDTLRRQISEGMTADAIRATWQPFLEQFGRQRAPYLLYNP